MRKTRFGLVLVVALLGGFEARAQFANKSLGLELGGFSFNDRNMTVGICAQLEGTFYVESGFEIGIRVPFAWMLTRTPPQLFGTGGQLHFRYLFSEESLRPYVGLAIDVLVIIGNPDPSGSDSQSGNKTVFFGPQAFAGLEYFVSDSIAIGARGFFTGHIAVNNQNAFRPTFGGYAGMHVYF